MTMANMISASNFANQNHEKNKIGYHNAGGHTKCDKYIIKLGTIEMGFNFNQANMWFNPLVLPSKSFVFNNVVFKF